MLNRIPYVPIPLVFLLLLANCQQGGQSEKDTIATNSTPPITLTRALADRLSDLPFECINIEFPNKLSQTLGGMQDLKPPKVLHPAFYGCFDWHSSVHGHWSLVRLLKLFPDLAHRDSIVFELTRHLSEDNIQQEVHYFQGKYNRSYERTYGWGWLLKLAEELHTWDDPLARQLEHNLQPLTELIAIRLGEYLPKLNYPIRAGTHTNTAFGLSLARDYAVAVGDKKLQQAIDKRAIAFYEKDTHCPIGWEPSGHDFLSPCLEEAALMRRVLPQQKFERWMDAFLPDLTNPDYEMVVGEVSDRTDGHLVHLDGYNFSRAWNLNIIAQGLPQYAHLRGDANRLIAYSLPPIFDDDYMGSHWLGSFALLALSHADETK